MVKLLRSLRLVVAVPSLCVACEGSTQAPPSPASPPDPHPARASVLEPGAVPPVVPPLTIATTTTAVAPHPVLATLPVRVRVVRVAAVEGEDGHGHTVRATHPVAIDLETSGTWPGTASAVTLQVGTLAFQTVGHPSLSTMRFIAADERALPTGADVMLQFGPDPLARRAIAKLPAVTP